MKKVSILMSIYNETLEEIYQSITSIVSQTYKNIEIIIVVDNPKYNMNEKILMLLDNFESKFTNIKILYNEKNIGLAMSMNKAFQISCGEYIARMDADDISLPMRIEKEIEILERNEFDFVCTGYEFIDENGKQISGKYKYYKPNELKSALVYTNCIHHPTIMMKRIIFDQIGGYRDFPCSQDYDMWLRLLESGCNFYMINEVLLKYRIRKNSTTNSKKFIQACTLFYISQLFYQRLKSNNDDYSKDNYERFIQMCNKKYNSHKKNINKIQNIQKKLGNGKFDFILRIYLLFKSRFIRDSYILKYKIIKMV